MTYDDTQPVGPQGGRTTITPGGLIKQTVYLPHKRTEELRCEAHRRHQSVSNLVRQAVGEFLDSL